MTEEETAAYRIFHGSGDKFLCRITAAFTINSFDAENYGSYTTGDSRRDLELAGEDVLTYRTIAQLAKLHSAGSKIQLSNPDDSLLIYNLTKKYLGEQAKVSSLYHVSNVPDQAEKERMERVIDDISSLVELINALQDRVKITLDATPMKNNIFGKLSGKVLLANAMQKRSQDALPDNILTEFTDNITSASLAESTQELTWQL